MALRRDLKCNGENIDILTGKPFMEDVVATIKTRYKYIEFAEVTDEVWSCVNRKHQDSLGTVEYYRTWRQWVFCPSPSTVFSVDCLQDIINFIGQLKGG